MLERDLCGEFHLTPVCCDLLEGAVEIVPPDTARAEDLVQSLDHERTVCGSPRHLIEVSSNPLLVSALTAWGENGATTA